MGNISNKNVDPDTAWKAQNRDQKENILYRYVNLQKGGDIVKVYEKEGPAGLEKYLRREVEPLLFHEGLGEKICKSDWMRFQARSVARFRVSVAIKVLSCIRLGVFHFKSSNPIPWRPWLEYVSDTLLLSSLLSCRKGY